jgi:capsular polysaccharide biosynthesis protein
LLLILVSFILAGLVGVGAALTADYLDSSFRTPDEVKEILRIPVFASIPVSEPSKGNGHEVKSGSVPKNGN